MRTSQAAFTD